MKEKIAYLFSILFLFFIPYSFSQTDFGYQEELEKPKIFLDYAYFKEGTGDNWRLEVYYKVFNNDLTFVKEKDEFRAAYEIEIVLFSKNKQYTASSHEEKYVVNSYQETQSEDNFLINQINLFAPGGDYKLSIKLIDHNSNQTEKSGQQINLPSLKGGEPVFSSLELARSVKQEADSSSKFVKRGEEIIPSVSDIFGDPDTVFWIYFELYGVGPENPENYLVSYELESGNKSTVFKDSTRAKLLQASDQTLYDFKKIELGTMPDRTYTLRLKLLNHEGKIRAKAEKELRIEWSQLYQVRTNWEKAVDLLRYLATDKELKELRETKGEEERIKKWQEFWKSESATSGTPVKELMEAYYKRIKYANEHFGIFGKEGYKTDLGMVYIKFGPPDEVETHPFELGSKAYQIWYYYRNDCRFLFMDVTGYGEYELQYPYKCKM